MIQVFWRADALEDFDEAFHWYEEQRPGLGLEFARDLDSHIARLPSFPRAFPVVFEGLQKPQARHPADIRPTPVPLSKAIMSMLNPPHPGDFIRTEIIASQSYPQGLSVTAAAQVLRVSRPALSSLLNGKANLSGEMGLRIEKAFGVKMDTLMRMQASFGIGKGRGIARTGKLEKKIHVRPFVMVVPRS